MSQKKITTVRLHTNHAEHVNEDGSILKYAEEIYLHWNADETDALIRYLSKFPQCHLTGRIVRAETPDQPQD